jgi:hypothetical protein
MFNVLFEVGALALCMTAVEDVDGTMLKTRSLIIVTMTLTCINRYSI